MPRAHAMAKRKTPILVHVFGAAAASALVAYWGLQLAAPAPPAVAGVAAPVPSRDADPRLAARIMGDVNFGAIAAIQNVQLGGVFVAGPQSSAVVSIDGKPARAVLLGQEVSAGTRLVEVRADSITLERDGARSTYAVPPLALAKSSTPVAGFRREGATLTAPSLDTAPSVREPGPRPGMVTGMPLQPRPHGGNDDAASAFAPGQPMPGMAGPRER